MFAALRPAVFFLLGMALLARPAAADAWADRPLAEVLDELIAGGARIVYSDRLVPGDLAIAAEPPGNDWRQRLAHALQSVGLELREGPGGVLLVVRAAAGREPQAAAQEARPPPLPEIIVTAGHYRLRYESPVAHTFLERELTAALPDLGDEPLRALWRLPGTASGGISARNHVRGGLRNEQLYLLDGVRLYEPFHLKDFEQVASIVNQDAIAGIDFHAAGYPARYGDRMSGVVRLELRDPPAETTTELGLSLFNASALSAGRFGSEDRGHWLASVRRGNLDVVTGLLEPDWGSPRYEDALLGIGWRLGDSTVLSANLLYSFDRISVAEPDGSEEARAKYRNSVAWLKAETDWSDDLSSETILSVTDVANSRSGRIEETGIVQGWLEDDRDFDALALAQHWRWAAGERWHVEAGFDLKRLDAEYSHRSSRTVAPAFVGLFGNEPLTERAIAVSPGGAQYAVYADLRWQPVERLTVGGGLRWDQQTYTTASDDRQASPRLHLLYRAGSRSELRVSAGRFYQAQEVNELPVSDGVTTFYPAQRARHLAAGLTHRFDTGVELRLEAYEKRYSTLAPRFENAFDPLVLLPELNVDRIRVDSDGARARGVELTLSGASRSTRWWASYSWADVADDTAAGDVARSWDQRHTVKAGLTGSREPWQWSVAFVAHTGWPTTRVRAVGDGTTPNLAAGNRNADRLGPFSSLDARLGRALAVPRGELDVFLEITNLYDRANPCCTEYRLEPDGTGGITLRANEGHWLPLVPSVGLLWRF